MYYVLSAGTNLGDRLANLTYCREALDLVPGTHVVSASAVYQTQPVGYARQDDFYNVCFLVESRLNPHEMLGVCLGLEAGLGRVRGVKNGPRVLDVDVIFAGNLQLQTENLVVPHPRYRERRFVLQPLLDIFVDGRAFGMEFASCLDKSTARQWRRFPPSRTGISEKTKNDPAHWIRAGSFFCQFFPLKCAGTGKNCVDFLCPRGAN